MPLIFEDYFDAVLYWRKCFSQINHLGWHVFQSQKHLVLITMSLRCLMIQSKQHHFPLNFAVFYTRAKTQNTSAIKWVALITCVFLACYGIMMRCSLLFLAGHKCSNDFYYKITQQVINSGINRKVYAFFKRDIKQECGRLLFKRRRYLT